MNDILDNIWNNDPPIRKDRDWIEIIDYLIDRLGIFLHTRINLLNYSFEDKADCCSCSMNSSVSFELSSPLRIRSIGHLMMTVNKKEPVNINIDIPLFSDENRICTIEKDVDGRKRSIVRLTFYHDEKTRGDWRCDGFQTDEYSEWEH